MLLIAIFLSIICVVCLVDEHPIKCAMICFLIMVSGLVMDKQAKTPMITCPSTVGVISDKTVDIRHLIARYYLFVTEGDAVCRVSVSSRLYDYFQVGDQVRNLTPLAD